MRRITALAKMVHLTSLLTLAGTATGQSTDPFPPLFDLNTLNGVNGFILTAAAELQRAGEVVSTGDLNGDGVVDLIISGSGSSNSLPGQVYVVFGGPGVSGSGEIELDALDGSNGFVVRSGAVNDLLGFSVSNAGDVNDDGVDDLIVGAPVVGPNFTGASYVVFGGAGVGASGVIDVSGLDGSNGFVINGAIEESLTGAAVSSAGDVNNDGVDDVIIGAPSENGTFSQAEGAAYVVFGGSGVGASGAVDLSGLNGANGFVLRDTGGIDSLGEAVSSAGDVNHDGIADVLIGGGRTSGSAPMSCYVVFGATGLGASGTIELSTLNGSDGFVVTGDGDSELGQVVDGGGDVNNDGVDDIVIGASDERGSNNSFVGAAYVVFGRDVAVQGDFAPSLATSTIDGSNGFGIFEPGNFTSIGFNVALAGDLNGDGVDEVVVTTSDAEESYVVFGRDVATQGGFGASFDVSTLDGENGFVATRDPSSLGLGGLGADAPTSGDINGDGVSDLIVGSVASGDPLFSGVTFVVFGRLTFAPTIIEQPVGVLLPSTGGAAAFSVRVEGGTGLTYQWRRDGAPLADGGNITGATTPDLTIAATSADVGVYDCIVSNGATDLATNAVILALRPGGFAGCNGADLVPPAGIVDLSDLDEFINLFLAGCP
ncbi:MAG: hypothetical protein AAGI53_12550 [Planctomycetota bacterium]